MFSFFFQQPFYPAGMMPWGPTSPAYFEMSNVFTMNGITPHNTFTRSNTRYNPRHRYESAISLFF